jgi:hypothetical protein
MSTIALFGFAEGKTADRYVYGKLCTGTCDSHGVTFQLVTAAELRGAGGKQSLLSFYLFLARANKAISDFKGKKTGAVFFLDKDIDDLIGTQIQSDHVVYTPTYDVEGILMRHGRAADAIAATAGLEERETAALIGDEPAWRRRCAENWTDWTTICIFCRLHNVRSTPGYRVISQVNDPATAPVDPQKLKVHIDNIEALSGMAKAIFDAEYTTVRQTVVGLFANNRHDEVFKGKWYQEFITAEMRAIAGVKEVDFRSLHAGFLGALATTIDTSGVWSDHWKARVAVIAAKLQ